MENNRKSSLTEFDPNIIKIKYFNNNYATKYSWKDVNGLVSLS